MFQTMLGGIQALSCMVGECTDRHGGLPLKADLSSTLKREGAHVGLNHHRGPQRHWWRTPVRVLIGKTAVRQHIPPTIGFLMWLCTWKNMPLDGQRNLQLFVPAQGESVKQKQPSGLLG
ncbi:unnamed protein product [Victoria cruziana]